MYLYYLKRREPVCITLAENRTIEGVIEFIDNDYYIKSNEGLIKISEVSDEILYICSSKNKKTEI